MTDFYNVYIRLFNVQSELRYSGILAVSEGVGQQLDITLWQIYFGGRVQLFDLQGQLRTVITRTSAP